MNETIEKLNAVMSQALFQLKALVNADADSDLLTVVKIFLLGVISTAVDLVELSHPGSMPLLYAEIEAIAKTRGLQSIRAMQDSNGTMRYSVSDIGPEDKTAAMNYLGQELATTLFKSIHDLPIPLRQPEMFLRGVEALLANLLHQKFDNPQAILASFTEHVGINLQELANSKVVNIQRQSIKKPN